jgi:hypothetical protein
LDDFEGYNLNVKVNMIENMISLAIAINYPTLSSLDLMLSVFGGSQIRILT